MRDPAAVAALQGSVARTAEWLRATCEAERAAGRRVYGYCAASRAVALLRVAGLDASLLAAVADASPDKHGRRMPGTDIPIIAPDALVAARPGRRAAVRLRPRRRGPRRPAPDRGGGRDAGWTPARAADPRGSVGSAEVPHHGAEALAIGRTTPTAAVQMAAGLTA